MRKILIKKFSEDYKLISFFISYLKKISNKSKIRIGVSGGSVSKFLLNNIKYLERYCKDNSVLIQLILIDERCVKHENHMRNDKNYKDKLKKSKYITFHNPFTNPKLRYLIYPIEKYRKKYNKLDIVLLGFGLDGHTAGVFDKNTISKNFDYIINKDKNGLRRISFSIEYLNSSKKVMIFSRGLNKFNFFKTAILSKNYIINYLNISEYLYLDN